MNVFDRAVNQWCYGKECTSIFRNSVEIHGEKCYYSDNTEMTKASAEGKEIVIIGICLDAMGRQNIAEELVNLSFDEFAVALDTLCGVYVIFRYDPSLGLQIFGDATRMMSVYYGKGKSGDKIVASLESLIVDDITEISSVSREVVRCAHNGAMELAGDMTMYDNVKCLIANHYLDMNDFKPVRYFPRESLVKITDEKEIDEIIDKTWEMVSCIINQLAKNTQFASPLTQGADSRVNCAFLRLLLPARSVVYYVLKLPWMLVRCEDIPYIKDIAALLGIDDFQVLEDVDVIDDDYVLQLRQQCGEIRGWGRKVWTYHPSIAARTIVNGQLIDQIGKASKGKGRPDLLTYLFLKLKLGNVSPFAHKKLKEWHDEAKKGSKGYSMYDLWGWEMRCGRWHANVVSVSSMLGVREFNFYNCTAILSMWCRIPRRLRVRKIIHKKLLTRMCPKVVSLPFDPFKQPSKHLPTFLNKWINVFMAGLIQEIGNYALDYIQKKPKRVIG